MVESMWQGGFLCTSFSNAWEFLEDLAEKTMKWETTKDDNVHSRYSGTRGSIHTVFDLSHLKSQFVALEKMIKRLVLQQSQPFQAP